jgi:hypothetical protein
MSILFSVFFHAGSQGEISCITKNSLVNKYGRKKYNGIKYHIILGDGGFMWPGNKKTDLASYKEFARRPFPVLCVIGNHEPILGMGGMKEVDIGIGEKVLLVNEADPFVAYLKRGKVYAIDGFKFLVLGGALSIDKDWRIPNVTWWEREYWTGKEKQDVYRLLEAENAFDCVISHTGPNRINKFLCKYLSPFPFIDDDVGYLNEMIDNMVQCNEWWCGHWHQDLYYFDTEFSRGYQYLFKTTKILDRLDNKMVVYNEFGKAERQGV